MYQRPEIPATGSSPRPENPGSATNFSKKRPHISTHNFTCAMLLMSRITVLDAAYPKKAYEYYKHAAALAAEKQTVVVLRNATHI